MNRSFSAPAGDAQENVQVVIRVRPRNAAETAAGDPIVVCA